MIAILFAFALKGQDTRAIINVVVNAGISDVSPPGFH
jgi:hypothetical protein